MKAREVEKEGLYWLLEKDEKPTIVKIWGFEYSCASVSYLGNDCEDDLECVEGEFVGPIEYEA